MRVICPNCQAKGNGKEEWIGKKIKCPKCKEPFVIEAPDDSSTSSYPQAAQPTAPPVPMATKPCSQCNIPTPEKDLLDFDGTMVCARCKGVYLQQLKEGVKTDDFVYGGFWLRFVAKFIDGIIGGIAGYILGVAAGLLLMSLTVEDPLTLVIINQLIGLAFGISYVTWFVGKFGATPGKMALGLKIVKPDGSGLSYLQAFGRYWAELLSGIILAIGYLMAAFDEEKRGLHDRICETRVIRTR